MLEIKVENIVPLKKFIIIEPLEAPTESESGLEMPEDTNPGTPTIGRVIKVGEDSQFKEGNLVFFRRYSVDELRFRTPSGESTVNLLQDDEVVAFVNQ